MSSERNYHEEDCGDARRRLRNAPSLKRQPQTLRNSGSPQCVGLARGHLGAISVCCCRMHLGPLRLVLLATDPAPRAPTPRGAMRRQNREWERQPSLGRMPVGRVQDRRRPRVLEVYVLSRRAAFFSIPCARLTYHPLSTTRPANPGPGHCGNNSTAALPIEVHKSPNPCTRIGQFLTPIYPHISPYNPLL